MAISNLDFIEGVRSSRRHFLKHLEGISDHQVTWKPYPEAKSILETVQHLIVDDRAALQSFQTGDEPDYESLGVSETDYSRLLTMLEASHQSLITYLTNEYGHSAMDSEATVWGSPYPAARAIAYLSSEDFFHAGQVSFIRLATDPSWDYYQEIYS